MNQSDVIQVIIRTKPANQIVSCVWKVITVIIQSSPSSCITTVTVLKDITVLMVRYCVNILEIYCNNGWTLALYQLYL